MARAGIGGWLSKFGLQNLERHALELDSVARVHIVNPMPHDCLRFVKACCDLMDLVEAAVEVIIADAASELIGGWFFLGKLTGF